jgi:biopolymer transport protein ExbD
MASQDAGDDGIVTGINVTPLVDILLVLLIVFMVSAKFVDEAGLKVHLPKAAQAQVDATPALTVKMDADGRLSLMELSMDEHGLAASLAREARANPGVRVTVAADESLSYKRVVQLLDLIKKAGVTRVALAAEQ